MDNDFGKLILRLRKSKKDDAGKEWTQAILSVKSGISQGSISRIENGKQPDISAATKEALLKALDAIGETGSAPMPPEDRQAFEHLKIILDSGDEGIKMAIRQNLQQFVRVIHVTEKTPPPSTTITAAKK